MSDSRIIRKMKSLMAMANDKSSENEATTALRQLHTMLAKHNISVEQLDEPEEEQVDEYCEEFRAPPWKRQVARAIARLYFCEMYHASLGKGKANIFFVGTESNRTFAMWVFKMVTTSIERDARKESREIYGKENSSFVNSFWTGAMKRIISRCRELANQAKDGDLQDDEGNTLPAMVGLYTKHLREVEAWLSANKNLEQGSARTQVKNQAGYSRGKAAGDRVQLSRAIQRQSSTKLIG
jgi:hypothetical protein